MPSFWTHLAFAREVRLSLGDAPRGPLTHAIAAYPRIFRTGMQGPDPFLFYLPAAFARRRPATLLHTEHTAHLLCRLFCRALQMSGKQRQIALSYAAGFLGHYVLDSHTHGFVYARAGTFQSADGFCIHNALEADLNSLAVARSFHRPLSVFPRPNTYELSPLERDVLCTLYVDLFSTVYGLRYSRAKISRALWSVRKVYRRLYDPRGTKATLFRHLERPLGRSYLSPLFLGESHYFADPANFAHRPWIDPFTGECSTASFFDLYDRALAVYLPLLTDPASPLTASPASRRALFSTLCTRDFHGISIGVASTAFL